MHEGKKLDEFTGCFEGTPAHSQALSIITQHKNTSNEEITSKIKRIRIEAKDFLNKSTNQMYQLEFEANILQRIMDKRWHEYTSDNRYYTISTSGEVSYIGHYSDRDFAEHNARIMDSEALIFSEEELSDLTRSIERAKQGALVFAGTNT